MKVIIIKVNDKVIGVSKINDITTKKFLELEKEVAENWNEKDKKILSLKDEITYLRAKLEEHETKIADLYHQIAVDRGEEE